MEQSARQAAMFRQSITYTENKFEAIYGRFL